MIPKVIHYCWFGGGQLPKDAMKCIDSWRIYMPEYEIKEWNESNFDINITPYTQEAYQAQKYAFVSDYARFWILYNYGGLYFDTDVEIIKPLDDIVKNGAFLGYEIDPNGLKNGLVNPGQGMGSEPHNLIYAKILSKYAELHFINNNGTLNTVTIVQYTTAILLQYGLSSKCGIQNVGGILIYPRTYFNPYDDATGRLQISSETYTIHWYSKTWLNVHPLRQWLSRIIHRILGVEVCLKIRRYFKL